MVSMIILFPNVLLSDITLAPELNTVAGYIKNLPLQNKSFSLNKITEIDVLHIIGIIIVLEWITFQIGHLK